MDSHVFKNLYLYNMNKNLQDSAPQLLEACKMARAIFHSQGVDASHKIFGEMYQKIEDAINAAEQKEVGLKKQDTSELYRSIDEIKNDYLENEKLVEAVINNKDLPFNSRESLVSYLDEFCRQLKSKDEFTKQEKDFKSHFMYWSKKKKDLPQKRKRNDIGLEDVTLTDEDFIQQPKKLRNEEAKRLER